MEYSSQDLVDRLWPMLSADAEQALSIAGEHATPFNMRSAVRAVFAYIDGSIFIIKHIVTVVADGVFPEAISNADRALLREETYSLNSKGEAYAQRKQLRLEDNLPFALSMLMRIAKKPFTLDRADRGWEAFLASIRLRNRLTHPRQATELEVSSQEFADLRCAYKWVSAQITRGLSHALLTWYEEGVKAGRFRAIEDDPAKD